MQQSRDIDGKPRSSHSDGAVAVSLVIADGPSTGDVYHNYYATRTIRAYGGDPWSEWYSEMYNILKAAQVREGHSAGSWSFKSGAHGDQAGRLYHTSMALMILELPNHLPPVYKNQSE